MTNTTKLLWSPDKNFKDNSQLNQYMQWLAREKNLAFADYHSLWEWSIEQTAEFWESIWEYFKIISHSPYTSILEYEQMPDVRWFNGSTLNYAEHIFRQATDQYPAIIFQSERQKATEISWADLKCEVGRLATYFKSIGVKSGDRVVAFIPNIPEATIAFLAANSLGAIWSSCSPDFGSSSVVDRFLQIEPKVLIAVDGYQYNGKPYDKTEVVEELCEALPSLEKIIFLPYLNENAALENGKALVWEEAMDQPLEELTFTPVPFDHPIWVLYSSGTTGKPKAITHSHGGCLLEHFKYVAFHNDVHPGERFFWFSTTGWMMWNYVQASLLQGATIILYDGSPGFPDMNVLWQMCEEVGIHHFGTSAPYIVACMKRELNPAKAFDLSDLRSISSTGAPLPPEAFDYVYQSINKEAWLCSMSGGTDVCTAFVGGNPLWPVYEGEIQCRALGCALFAYNEMGQAIEEEVGEMVITKPMPSMPIFFWNDQDDIRYLSSYFAKYEGIWWHGDWVKITDRKGLVIFGRSDATLNRQGIRIGTAEIYRSVNKIEAIADALVVNLELSGGRHYMPLFVVMAEGQDLNESTITAIKKQLRTDYTPRHVPDEIIRVEEIPYTISGKKLEAPVKKVLMGIPMQNAANKDAMRNPWAMDFFKTFAKKIQNNG